jgi:hypothetical protein
MSTKAKWLSGKLSFYDGYETVKPLSPVVFEDDFLGTELDKHAASTNTGAKWTTVETSLNSAIALVANSTNGVAAIIVDTDDNAEVGCLHHGDNLQFSLKNGLMMEFRATFAVLPLTGTEEVMAVMGLASAHNTIADSVATNVWFRVQSAAQTALLWESDDGNTDDNDNATGVTLVAGTYNNYRIDARSLANGVKFYVDSTLVGTTADFDTNLTASEAKVQPYFCVSKAASVHNTGKGTLYLDYCRVWQNRS